MASECRGHEQILITSHMDLIRLLNVNDNVLDYLVNVRRLLRREAEEIRRMPYEDDQNRKMADKLPRMGSAFLIEFVRALRLCSPGSPNSELADKLEISMTRADKERVRLVPVAFVFEAPKNLELGETILFRAPADCSAFNNGYQFQLMATDEPRIYRVPTSEIGTTRVGSYPNAHIIPSSSDVIPLKLVQIDYNTRIFKLELVTPPQARPYAHEDQMKWASYRAQLPNAAAAAGSASDGKTQPPSAGTAGTPAPSDSAEAAPVRPPPSGAADGTGQLLVQKGGAGGKPFPCGGTDSTGPATAEVALAEARIVASGSGQGSVKVSSQDPNSGYAANPRAEQQIESTPRPRHQPAPAPRTVHQQPPDNPWDSHDFLESYDWLVENLAPVKLRTSVRKYILQHQLSKLKNAGVSDTVHNESVFLFIRAHGWTSYRHFLKVLSKWPVARAQEIASDLQKAAGPST